MKVIEVPLEEITSDFLMELQQYGLEAIIDGDKKTLQLISVNIVDVLIINSDTSFRSPN
jgi:hypothetical protein